MVLVPVLVTEVYPTLPRLVHQVRVQLADHGLHWQSSHTFAIPGWAATILMGLTVGAIRDDVALAFPANVCCTEICAAASNGRSWPTVDDCDSFLVGISRSRLS